MKYRWHSGYIVWLIHRITGIALSFYLLAHIFVTSTIKEPALFEKVMAVMHHPLVKIGEIFLWGAVVAHVIAGIRITLLEIGVLPTKFQKQATIVGGIIGIILWLLGASFFLKGLVYG